MKTTLEFPSVNRSLIIIRMRGPFVEWANQLPDRSEQELSEPIKLEEINIDPTAYLIPEIFDYEDLEAYLDKMWIVLFEALLSGWTLEPTFWPKKKTRKMFNEWFEITTHSIVYDLWAKDPIDYNDY